jgi:hypothetical protein
MMKAQGVFGMGDQLLQNLEGVAYSVEDNDTTIYRCTADIRIHHDRVTMIVLDPDGTICRRVV